MAFPSTLLLLPWCSTSTARRRLKVPLILRAGNAQRMWPCCCNSVKPHPGRQAETGWAQGESGRTGLDAPASPTSSKAGMSIRRIPMGQGAYVPVIKRVLFGSIFGIPFRIFVRGTAESASGTPTNPTLADVHLE